jgi:CheY-like chemotaxis protein
MEGKEDRWGYDTYAGALTCVVIDEHRETAPPTPKILLPVRNLDWGSVGAAVFGPQPRRKALKKFTRPTPHTAGMRYINGKSVNYRPDAMVTTLLVEDNAGFRKRLKDFLEDRFPKIRILEASNGQEAFEQIDRSLPDLVFMDIELPGENGLRLTRSIKEEHPEICVIILTSYDLPEYREEARRCGADRFLAKGAPVKEICAALESCLAGTGLAGPGPDPSCAVS